jgi:dolichyl-diphosphooligosaccharide--protein glycosyltransferase
MNGVRAATEALLAEKPQVKPKLEELHEIDATGDWEFHDIPLDSGEFGELVSRGIAEEQADGYRLADPDAVAAALRNDAVPPTDSSDFPFDIRVLPSRQQGFALALLAGALCLVAILRLLPINGVFPNGTVILAGNDPWGYRFWVENLLGANPSEIGGTSVSSLAGEGLSADVLYLLFGSGLAAVLGGTSAAVGLALAWYPVIVAVLTAYVLYLLALRLAADRRVGLTTVLLFGVTPVLAYRTMIGFADHDALDFLWLALTLYALVILAAPDRETDFEFWAGQTTAICLLGVSIAAQTLSWRGGPLLLIPIGVFVFAVSISGLRTPTSSGKILRPVMISLAVASVLALGTRFVFDWLPLYRIGAPALLLIGTLTIWGFETVVRRRELRVGRSLVALIIMGLVGMGGVLLAVPSLWDGVVDFVSYMEYYTWTEITETRPLFGSGPIGIFRPVFLLGLPFFLGTGGLAAATLHAKKIHRPSWLVIAVYGWFFLLMAVIQNRFAGPLALIWAVIAGVALVHLLSVLDILPAVGSGWARPSSAADFRKFRLPDWRTLGYLAVCVLVVSSVGLFQIPIKQDGLLNGGPTYEVARAIDSNADQRGLEYPQNYVFSEWAKNRAYNHIVNGHSKTYTFARDNYASFLRSTDPEAWYARLRNRTGYIVTRWRNSPPDRSIQARLHQQYGSATPASEAVSHYRAIYSTQHGSLVAFALVEGATVSVSGPPNSSVSVSTSVAIPPHDTWVAYEQRGRIQSNGTVRFVVPYPGTYTVDNTTFEVSETAVYAGRTVRVDLNKAQQ